MNALIRKEVRLLLPSFIIGLVLASLIWLIPAEPAPDSSFRASVVVLMFVFSPVLLIMMTLGSFGRELSAGTFSLLLAQPVSRSRVWWTKTLLLAAAVVLIWAAWWFSLSHNMNFLAHGREDQRDAFLMAALFVMVAYSGGLWTTLLFRQLAAAFWFTLLTPAALAMAIVGVLHKRMEPVDPALEPVLVIAFLIYSVAGFLFARWLFIRAQDTHWTGGDIALPKVRGLAGWFGRRDEQRQRRPCAALWVKELQLHQSQFVLAGVIAIMHLAVLAARKLGGDFKNSPALETLLEHFWVLWLAMPLLVGCTAVADERKLGTLEGQLSLPSRRRTQFVIKFASALLLSVALGAVVPMLFEGTRLLSGFNPQSDNDASNYAITTPGGTVIPIGHIVAAIRAVLPFLAVGAYAALIALVSFYASTLARNTMQALAPAVLGTLVTWFMLFTVSAPEQFFHYRLWRGGLIYWIGLPVMTVTLGGLMYWNFKRVLVGWNVWRRNVLVLLAALVGVATATAATYHRVWEHFMTLEPPHGSVRLGQSVDLQSGYFHLTAEFADGRNWSSRLTFATQDWNSMLTGDWKVTEMPGTSGYLDGTNWSSVGRSYRDVVGVRSNGELWVTEQPEPVPATGLLHPSPNPPMMRLGADADWRMCAVSGSVAFLLKTNGTLWRLGTNIGSWKKWPGFAAFAPEQSGGDSDWAEVSFVEHGQITFRKTDGRSWRLQQQRRGDSDGENIQLGADLVLHRVPYLDGQRSVATIWIPPPLGGDVQLGLGNDGALRILGYAGWRNLGNRRLGQWNTVSTLLYDGATWLALANNRHDAVALKADGSLWKLDFPADPIKNPGHFSLTRLSRHSDWVALAESMDGVVGLAADGSLWFWAMEGRSYYPSAFTFQPLLAASRQPQLIGNIFDSPAP